VIRAHLAEGNVHEALRQYRATVDVLTLTATPIPRTLSMAMAGIRDLSVIESPPADRLAVETVVSRFDARVIKEAIERELGRGGQVFVVHNRIQSLPALVRLIQRLAPRARVAMAHGQLRESILERTMLDYVGGAYDVLVATAIIESGLDIPASNTIIINRADRLGLAQLYQLRGRVGRDRLQAYAYLLIPADGRVDETAAKRLRVIQELTALGSGLKVALRDMEIRGAGNLLGAQQHGQIEMVGFDLYLKLLEEAVRELRGELDLMTAVSPDVFEQLNARTPAAVRDLGPSLESEMLWFNQSGLPGRGSPGDVAVDNLGPNQGEFLLLDTNAPPQLQPGQRYYLGVANFDTSQTNTFNLSVAFDRTDPDLVNPTLLSNAVPYSSTIAVTAAGQD
jgi:transcription-repair coupling factor (superfamily II helicase)